MATDQLQVDPTNAEQLRAWDGDEGGYWAAHADHFERALERYDAAFFAAAEIGGGDRVLDIGCGTGGTTRCAGRAATGGSVVGVDLSSAMLDVARRRAAEDGLDHVRFEQVDAQIHRFDPGLFDIAIGRTSVMFFGDRVEALRNVGRALRPDGRLVLLTWQPITANEWFRAFSGAFAAGRDLPTPPPGAPGPFSLADPEVITSVLASAGFASVSVDGHEEPMWFGEDPDDAYQFVLGLLAWMLEGLDDHGTARALGALRTSIEGHATPDGVLYDSATWIIRATRP
jgi:SAM-dependent methyltransferase